MKKSLYALSILTLALVGCGRKDDDTRSLADKTKDATNTAVDRTKEAASDVKNTISNKLVEWKLTPSDIKADLSKGGRVVRSRTAVAGEKMGDAMDNARIVTVINAKLVGDADLSALKIDVDANSGVVTLKGSVASPDLIGRAMALALDTDGVREVVSLLTVSAK